MLQKKNINLINRIISKAFELLQKVKIFGFKLKIRKNFQILHDKFKIIDKRCIELNKGNFQLFSYFSMISENAPKGNIVECGLGKLKSFQMLKLLNESKKFLDLTLSVAFQTQLRKIVVQEILKKETGIY